MGIRPLYSLALGIMSSAFILLPTHAAERITLTYGIWGRSLAVSDLDAFAQDGTLEGSVGQFLSRLSPEQQAQIREVLQARYEVDPVMVSRFSYTASGEQLLQEIGELVSTPAGQNGLYGLRAALVLAASDPDGLSILNFLRQYPTDIQIDIRQALRQVELFSTLVDETDTWIAKLEQHTEAIASREPEISTNPLADVRQPGSFDASVQTLTLYDATRDRTLVTDLYRPNGSRPESGSIPLIVISNGLGARRDRFDELANYLASYGFAVAIPDHPGSDRQRLLDFYNGLQRENFEANEFIDRPLDISFLLDELEKRNTNDRNAPLDLQRVGLFGYSFGGTTALSLAGAEIDLNHLERDCETQPAVINISLLYQCRALAASRISTPLRDERIQSIYVFVPFGKSLFGPDGMAQVETPIMWEATNQDILTPLVIEQLPAFDWLTGSDRYLAVASGLPHARLTLDVINRLTNQNLVWDEIKPITQTYHNVLSLIFFKAYIAQDDRYRSYLQASYIQAFANDAYPLSFVRSLPD
ncbi:MAG TPA: alpha/beta hydrolase [Elainellaceae cyanobacterium]